MRPSTPAFAAAFLMAACSPASDTPADGPVPPADAPAVATAPGFAKPFRALGTEPFWGLQISLESLKLEGPDRTTLEAPNPGPAVQGETAVWAAQGAGSVALKVTLAREDCSDGMSDLTYPFRARVEVAAEVLTGCAAPVDAWPQQPRP